MILKFNIKLCRTLKNPKQGTLHRIVSYVAIEFHGTYAHEAMTKARQWLPGWEVIDWKIVP